MHYFRLMHQDHARGADQEVWCDAFATCESRNAATQRRRPGPRMSSSISVIAVSDAEKKGLGILPS